MTRHVSPTGDRQQLKREITKLGAAMNAEHLTDEDLLDMLSDSDLQRLRDSLLFDFRELLRYG